MRRLAGVLFILTLLFGAIPDRVQAIQLDCPGSTEKVWQGDKYVCDYSGVSREPAPVVETRTVVVQQSPPVIVQPVPYPLFLGGVAHGYGGPGFYYGYGPGYYPGRNYGSLGLCIGCAFGGHHGHHGHR